MASEPAMSQEIIGGLPGRHVVAMAIIFLGLGVGSGYVLRGLSSPPASAASARTASAPAQSAGTMPNDATHSLAGMQHLADQQAAPLIERLKTDGQNSALLVQVGAIYHRSHQYKQAVQYYGAAVKIEPRNVAYRTKLASSMYRGGDVDGAIAELNDGLRYDPKNANALFDLGMIKLDGKHDGKGALAAWQKLLKGNPQLSSDQKAQLQNLIAKVMTTMPLENRQAKGASTDASKAQ